MWRDGAGQSSRGAMWPKPGTERRVVNFGMRQEVARGTLLQSVPLWQKVWNLLALIIGQDGRPLS